MQPATSTKKPFTRTVWYWVLMAVGTVVALCLLAAVADAAVYYSKVHEGVSVRGLKLGGMTRGDATAALSRMVQIAEAKPVTLKSGGRTWTVMPRDLGTTVSVDTAVDEAIAVSRRNNLLADIGRRFELYFHPTDLPLQGSVDQDKIATFVSTIAAELHVTPVNADLAVQGGTVAVTGGTAGQDVDQYTLRDELQSLLLDLQSATLDVPLVVKRPDVVASDLEAAQQRAQAMLSAPIILTDLDKNWTLTPEQLAGFIDFRWEQAGNARVLTPYLAEGKMSSYLISLAPDCKVNPKNASFKAKGDTITVIPSVNGETLDVTGTAAAINAVAARASGRTIKVALTITEPDFTTAEARTETFHDKLSSYTTKYNCPANRQTNVRITTQYATNVFLAPGQEYSFDRQIGPRTAARGYKLAPGITGPNTLDDVLGGGICQVSTTMFNAVFEAGLKVTERHNHSIFINHYPLGRDATVTGGGKNLRFVNDTSHYVWIRGTSTGVVTTITIWGTSDGRKVSSHVGSFYNITVPGPPVTIQDPTLPKGATKTEGSQVGRSLKTYRTVTLHGKVIHNDVWTSVWPAYPETIVVGTG